MAIAVRQPTPRLDHSGTSFIANDFAACGGMATLARRKRSARDADPEADPNH
jgi:hypothetical protein